MATQLYDIVEVELQDGRKVTLKPLPIKRLKEFMKVVTKLDTVKDEEEAMLIRLIKIREYLWT